MIRNFEVFKPLDFLAQVTQNIPNRSQHLIRYYGRYSNKSRGMRKKAVAVIMAPAAQEIEEYQKLARRRWAALIKKVYEVDPLICPNTRVWKCQAGWTSSRLSRTRRQSKKSSSTSANTIRRKGPRRAKTISGSRLRHPRNGSMCPLSTSREDVF